MYIPYGKITVYYANLTCQSSLLNIFELMIWFPYANTLRWTTSKIIPNITVVETRQEDMSI